MKPDTLQLLFIGGPADGQVRAIPANATRLEYPYMPPLSGTLNSIDPPQFYRAVYKRSRIGDSHFFYYETDGCEEALRKLLRNYAPRLALAAEQQERLVGSSFFTS